MKHRSNLYLVVRKTDYKDVVLGAYRTLERADEVAAAVHQEFIDRFGNHPDNPDVVVQITTYYDE